MKTENQTNNEIEEFEIDIFFEQFENFQEHTLASGLPFVISIARHIIRKNCCAPSELVTLLHQSLPILGRPFIKRLMQLSTGADPKRHSFWIDKFDRVRLHPSLN